MATTIDLDKMKNSIDDQFKGIDEKRDIIKELEEIRKELDKFYDDKLEDVKDFIYDSTLYTDNEQKKEAIELALEEKDKQSSNSNQLDAFKTELKAKTIKANKDRDILVKYAKQVLQLKSNILSKSEKFIDDKIAEVKEKEEENNKKIKSLEDEENKIRSEHPNIANEISEKERDKTTLELEYNTYDTDKQRVEEEKKVLEKKLDEINKKMEKLEGLENKEEKDLTEDEKKEIDEIKIYLEKPENDVADIESKLSTKETEVSTLSYNMDENRRAFIETENNLNLLNGEKSRLEKISTEKNNCRDEITAANEDLTRLNDAKSELKVFIKDKYDEISEQKDKFKEAFKEYGIDFIDANKKKDTQDKDDKGKEDSEQNKTPDGKESDKASKQQSSNGNNVQAPANNGIVNNPGQSNVQEQTNPTDTNSTEYLLSKFKTMEPKNKVLSEFTYEEIVRILPELSSKEKKIVNSAVLSTGGIASLSEADFNAAFTQFGVSYDTYQKLSNPEDFSELSYNEIEELKSTLVKYDEIKDSLGVDIKEKFDSNFVKAIELGTLYDASKTDKVFTRLKKAVSKGENQKKASRKSLMGVCCNYESAYTASRVAPATQQTNNFQELLRMGITPPNVAIEQMRNMQDTRRTVQPQQTPPPTR